MCLQTPMPNYSVVQAGPYFAFTRTELDAELARYKAAVQAGAGSNLQSAGLVGESYSFGPRQDWSLAQWQEHIQGAYAQIAPGLYEDPPGRSFAFRIT